MDFSKLDARSAAEIPSEMPILDQQSGEPVMDGKKVCAVLVKGVSSRSAQAQIRAEEMARAKAARGKKPRDGDDEDWTKDIQKTLTSAASRFVAGFVNVQRIDPETNKLRDLTDSPEDVAWFFDLNMVSLPYLLRGDGSNITKRDNETDADFAERKKLEMDEWLRPSFSQQVIDWAKEDGHFLLKLQKN